MYSCNQSSIQNDKDRILFLPSPSKLQPVWGGQGLIPSIYSVLIAVGHWFCLAMRNLLFEDTNNSMRTGTSEVQNSHTINRTELVKKDDYQRKYSGDEISNQEQLCLLRVSQVFRCDSIF